MSKPEGSSADYVPVRIYHRNVFATLNQLDKIPWRYHEATRLAENWNKARLTPCGKYVEVLSYGKHYNLNDRNEIRLTREDVQNLISKYNLYELPKLTDVAEFINDDNNTYTPISPRRNEENNEIAIATFSPLSPPPSETGTFNSYIPPYLQNPQPSIPTSSGDEEEQRREDELEAQSIEKSIRNRNRNRNRNRSRSRSRSRSSSRGRSRSRSSSRSRSNNKEKKNKNEKKGKKRQSPSPTKRHPSSSRRRSPSPSTSKRKPGRPKGSANKIKMTGINLVHPETNNKVAKMTCEISGNQEQKRRVKDAYNDLGIKQPSFDTTLSQKCSKKHFKTIIKI